VKLATKPPKIGPVKTSKSVDKEKPKKEKTAA
jgi:hypothetical protein